MSGDLAAWLLEQVKDDERDARYIPEARHAGYAAGWSLAASATLDVGGTTIYLEDRSLARHIVRWDPARVLAECAAKRALIEEHRRIECVNARCLTGLMCRVCDYDDPNDTHGGPCPTIRLLAQPYAGREGWREEWGMGE